jgi:hypothetical protein
MALASGSTGWVNIWAFKFKGKKNEEMMLIMKTKRLMIK